MANCRLLPLIHPWERTDYPMEAMREYDRLVELERERLKFEALCAKIERERAERNRTGLAPDGTKILQEQETTYVDNIGC